MRLDFILLSGKINAVDPQSGKRSRFRFALVSGGRASGRGEAVSACERARFPRMVRRSAAPAPVVILVFSFLLPFEISLQIVGTDFLMVLVCMLF